MPPSRQIMSSPPPPLTITEEILTGLAEILRQNSRPKTGRTELPCEGDFDDEHLATGSKEPEKADHEQDAQMDDIRNELAPFEEYCQLLITSAWDNVSARMTIFEEWLHFGKEVCIKDISSFESLVTIEEQLLEWGETEEVSDLFERRSLIMYKVLELELEKLYHEHLANFKLDVPSVNHVFLCIRRLHKELRMIAAVHRDHLAMVGLPFINQDISYLEFASHQEHSPTLEFSSLADNEQGASQAKSHQIDQQAAENMAMTSHEHRAQEIESPVQTDGRQDAGNEHQAQDGHGIVSGFDRSLDEPSIVLTVTNPETVTASEQNTCDLQGPDPSNLQLTVSASADSSISNYWILLPDTYRFVYPCIIS
ncbi:epsin-2 [Dorcoceras hygrometricum]|uniref:Epsin-2 n=1 Tax=Dorcoceras hygrometricum TaxID=472368 RepID=A0A2Z7DAV5_9LAMI|nr:epsin-2 [Dorcoceras hygrometricum]